MRKKLAVLLLTLVVAISSVSPSYTIASIDNKKISLMGIYHSDGADRTSWIDTSANNIGTNIGTYTVSKIKGFSISDFLTQLVNQDMVVVHTHGAQNSMIACVDGVDSSVTSTIVDNVFSTNSLSQLRICYIGACSCGAGGSTADNFVNTIFEQGALCVIGYLGSVVTACNRYMLNQFCYYIGQGYVVNNALTRAEQDVLNKYGEYGGVNNRLVRGIGGIAMTDSSYKVIGNSTYSLNTYSAQTISIASNDILSMDETSICTVDGDVFTYDKDNNIIAYTRLNDERNSSSSHTKKLSTFLTAFDIEDYEIDEDGVDTSEIVCMRYYINDIKTNDIIYYSCDKNDELSSYGYPRVGNAKIVEEKYADLNSDLILQYISDNYGSLDVCNIILDVDDVTNPYVNVSYIVNSDGYECIDNLSISLGDILMQ